MRFLLLDRIDSWIPDRTLTGRKVTSAAEQYWQPGPDGLHMPEELVLETICQAATWLILLSTHLGKRALLLSVDDMRCLAAVRPGDVLVVTVTVVSRHDEAAVVDGLATVDGHAVLRANGIMCALRDATDLDAKDNTERTLTHLLEGP